MTITLKSIHTYPVKGLRGIDHDSMEIAAHGMLADDRRFVISAQSAGSTEILDGWARKSNFLQLVNTPKLIELGTQYDAASTTLTILRNGRAICRGNLETPMGRTVIEDFLKAFLKNDVPGTPKIQSVPDTRFGDMQQPYISLINLASVRDLGERIVQAEIDPVRFRGNLLVDGMDPWRELDWQEGQIIAINGIAFRMIHPITRCKATSLNPATGDADVNIPVMLRKGVNHLYMGVYLEAVEGGTIAPNSPIEVRPL